MDLSFHFPLESRAAQFPVRLLAASAQSLQLLYQTGRAVYEDPHSAQGSDVKVEEGA